MENILQWGLDFIRLLQSRPSPSLKVIMIGITWLGSTAAYMAIIPLVYWCINDKKGFKLGIAILVSAWLNITLKFLFDQPRPFFAAYDPSLQMISEKMGGLPSGHAQNALVMWIIIASWIRRKWAYAAAVLMCLAVSFSRMYLGVHFPSDILAGWLLGGAVLCVYFLLGKKIEELLARGGRRGQMITTAVGSFIMILYRPSEDLLMPGALLLGLGIGFVLNMRYVQFEGADKPGGKPGVRYGILAVRFLLGMTVTALILVLFRKIIPAVRGTSFFTIIYFVQYALTGLWVSAGAPWLYRLLHLAGKRAENGTSAAPDRPNPDSK
jgi:membrane-associated phospholipid phosphatase